MIDSEYRLPVRSVSFILSYVCSCGNDVGTSSLTRFVRAGMSRSTVSSLSRVARAGIAQW